MMSCETKSFISHPNGQIMMKPIVGTLRIYPNEAFIEQLKQDHRNMTEMFFGNAPDFNDTLSAIQNIERVIKQNIGKG